MGKLKKINRDLIDFVANSIDTLLAMIGFIALYPAPFVLGAITLGNFIRSYFIEGVLYLILTITSFYLGKGIQKYLEKKTND